MAVFLLESPRIKSGTGFKVLGFAEEVHASNSSTRIYPHHMMGTLPAMPHPWLGQALAMRTSRGREEA